MSKHIFADKCFRELYDHWINGGFLSIDKIYSDLENETRDIFLGTLKKF